MEEIKTYIMSANADINKIEEYIKEKKFKLGLCYEYPNGDNIIEIELSEAQYKKLMLELALCEFIIQEKDTIA